MSDWFRLPLILDVIFLPNELPDFDLNLFEPLPKVDSYCVGTVKREVPDRNISKTPFRLGMQAVTMDMFIIN